MTQKILNFSFGTVFGTPCCWLVRISLFCSDQDPGGLLLLPEKGVSANFDISEVLSVMDTLLLVAAREVRELCSCFFVMSFVGTQTQAASLPFWIQLFVAVQVSRISFSNQLSVFL